MLVCRSGDTVRLGHTVFVLVVVACSSMPDGVAERLLSGAQKGVIQSIGHLRMDQHGIVFTDDT